MFKTYRPEIVPENWDSDNYDLFTHLVILSYLHIMPLIDNKWLHFSLQDK